MRKNDATQTHGTTTTSETRPENPPHNEDTTDYGIPKLSQSSTLLDTDWEMLKIRMGISLMGPNKMCKEFATTTFLLKNIENASCYWDTSSSPDIIGVENNQISFWVIASEFRNNNGGYAQVKDLLSDNALKVDPFVSTLESGNTACVWEVQNGYFMVVTLTFNSSFSWYDQYVSYVVHARSLGYLGLTDNDDNLQDNTYDPSIVVTGKIMKNEGVFPDWKIVLNSSVIVQDLDGEHSCDTLYFYDGDTLNGHPISDYAGKTVTLKGIPENYRNGGDFFLNDPTFV